MTFRDWLRTQEDEEGPIGELALLAHDDASSPPPQPTARKEYDRWAVYTWERLGSPGPFLMAWKAWKDS